MNLTSKRWADVPRVAAHEVGRPRFAIRNPYVEGMGDFEVQPIYDYYGVAAATAVTSQDLFTVPRGQNHAQGGLNIQKTYWHTNMTQARQLPNPNRILIRRIAAYALNRMNQVDTTRFLDETFLTLVIGSKPFLRVSTLAKFPAGGGAWNQSTFASASVAGNGVPQCGEGYGLRAPASAMQIGGVSLYPEVDGISIAQGQDFAVTLDPTLCTVFNALGVGFTTAAAGATPAGIGVHVILALEGTQLIPVQ